MIKAKCMWLLMLFAWGGSIPWAIYLVMTDERFSAHALWIIIPVYALLAYAAWLNFRAFSKHKD